MDIAQSIIRQRNACPICHLPLRYGFVNRRADLPMSPPTSP